MRINALFMVALSAISILSTQLCQAAIPDKNRQLMCQNWLAAAKKITGEDLSAQNILDFVILNARVSSPSFSRKGLATRTIDAAAADNGLAVVCTEIDDATVSTAWTDVMRTNEPVVFIAKEKPTLVLRSDIPMTPFWRSIFLLRRSLNANTHFNGTPETEDPIRNQAIDDYFAYRLAFDRLEKFGGKRYAKVLKKEMKRISASAEAVPQRGLHRKELDRIFGPSLSDIESREREKMVTLHAKFEAIANKVAPEAIYAATIEFLQGYR